MRKRTFNPDVDTREWRGGYYPYDILKEAFVALVVIMVLVTGLAVLFGSPDDRPVTLQQWSVRSPVDFATTTLNELDGTSTSSAYGAPYDRNFANNQTLGPLRLAQWAGVRVPVNAARDFVIAPLTMNVTTSPALSTALASWRAATNGQRNAWLSSYSSASSSIAFSGGHVTSSATSAGPVNVLIDSLTSMARSGALDHALETGQNFYTLDYTKPLLFLSDGSYFASLGAAQNLTGTQWGMMNETGNYPGQAWLWLYTFWYQVPPYNTSHNGDVLVWATMMLLTALLILVPFIPGLRSIPRWSRVYRLIWREHYRRVNPTT